MLVTCPFCGEPAELDLDVDADEPGTHDFVQDCDVCCRPWAVHVVVGYSGDISVDIGRDS